eukprot:4632423-Amphidinium_carterae.2
MCGGWIAPHHSGPCLFRALPKQGCQGQSSSSSSSGAGAAKADEPVRGNEHFARMSAVQAFDIYGGVAGFFTYGPPGSQFCCSVTVLHKEDSVAPSHRMSDGCQGCAVKNNLIRQWRQHFVIEDSSAVGLCASGVVRSQPTP